jgi:cobalt-zinc-cadmium efflux system outer membrane protein
MFPRSACTALAALLCCAPSARSQTVLTVDRVLDLAERQSPEVLIARTRTAQAQGALETARLRLPANPEVDGFLGSRSDSSGARSVDSELSFVQRFEVGGQRAYRIAAATAAATQHDFEIGASVLDAQTAALSAFYRAVYAQETRRLMDEARALAEEAVRAARARYQSGETAVLDVNVARVELARARRDQLTAASRMEGALAELRAILALPTQEPVVVQAALRAPEVPAVDVLLARLSERSDLRALTAGVDQAEAELSLTRATRAPDLFAGIGWRREDQEPVAGVRFGLTLPLFRRQTGAIVTAAGRVSEARAALEARRVALEARLRGAYARYLIAQQAAEVITATAVPLVTENEQLSRESYQAGKIGLLELLVIRREGFAARREAVDAQLEATLTALEARGIAGVLR